MTLHSGQLPGLPTSVLLVQGIGGFVLGGPNRGHKHRAKAPRKGDAQGGVLAMPLEMTIRWVEVEGSGAKCSWGNTHILWTKRDA